MIFIMQGIKHGQDHDEKGNKRDFLLIKPERGVWTYFECDHLGKLWVKIDASKRIPYSFFLRLFEGTSDDDWLMYTKNYLQREYSIEEAKKNFHSWFNEKYNMSESVRNDLNEIIYGENLFLGEKSDVLTKRDILAIGEYLKQRTRI